MSGWLEQDVKRSVGKDTSGGDAVHDLPYSKFQTRLRILKEVLLDRFLISLFSFVAGVQFAIFVIERGLS